MSTGKKLLLTGIGLAALGGIVYGSIRYKQKGITPVQTGRVVRQDLVSQVTASGEIKPKNYINVGAQYMGILTEILVKEGDRVKKGQLLAKLETVQPAADVAAQQATLKTAQADLLAQEAAIKSAQENLKTVQASLQRAQADLEKAAVAFDRARQLLASQLIAQQDYDQRKSEYDAAVAGVSEAQARVSQTRAQLEQSMAQRESAVRRIDQLQANLTRLNDVLQKYYSLAPLDGVVTNLPVRVGETVVPGIQNSPASLIMTIADMSEITAEVRVDETDIVNVKLNQPAEITVDAIPGQIFRGRVSEIGTTAIIRSTGLSASQSTVSTQEAKDFKVVIAMENPPEGIRPGLSCTAKITTATRNKVLTIPIQALTVRTAADLAPEAKAGGVQAADKSTAVVPPSKRREEVQGVFVVSGNQVTFRKVATGVTGASDIEVVDGLQEGEEIVTGSYKVLRTIRPGAAVKVDNKAAGTAVQ